MGPLLHALKLGVVVGGGWWVAYSNLVSAQGPLVLVGGLKGLGLRVWGQGLTIWGCISYIFEACVFEYQVDNANFEIPLHLDQLLVITFSQQ